MNVNRAETETGGGAERAARLTEQSDALREANDRLQQEIQDRQRAQEALARERDLLHSLLDTIPDRIYFKDTRSRFLRISRALAQYFKLNNPDEAVGKWDFDFFTDEHASQAFADEQRILQTGQPLVGIVEKETLPGGDVSWVNTTKMPLLDRHGDLVGTFGISRDISELKRAEEVLRQAKDSAEDANRAKSQFLANMSHELRTPLNSIIGFANILLKNKEGGLNASQLTFLDRIQANGKHLLGLINEILDLSKIEARKVELQLSSVALDVLVRETLAQQEALVRDKPVELLTDLPGQIAPFVTDADRLKQIIINLVSNALKFTERGSVTVRVVADPASHIPSRVEVRDTGIGIPGEKLGLIFEAFQQAEAGTARKYGGTGLGLSISQALCQLMGYRIEVTSEVGHGSTFSVVLAPGVGGITAGLAPAVVRTVPAPAPSRAAPAIPRTADLAGKLVLIIDDELDSRTLLTHLIEEFGCQVIAAASGEQGLRMAREFQPDIITVDLLMPRLDGWDVMRAMKADPLLRDIPVVVVSVIASENRGRIFGAVDVLQKPVVREDVLAVLERNLPPGKPSVLVIDDEADARQIMRAHLEEIAGEIREAQNGREALVLLEQHLPDVVLLDLLMPLMDGVSFLNLLRSDKRYRNLPVVVVTAKHLTAAETEQLRQQSQEVLAKTEVFAGKLKILLQQLCARNRPKGIETSPRSAESAVSGVEGGRATS